MGKLLFILKKRQIYSDSNYAVVNSGLYNSAMFVNQMLQKSGVDSRLVQVVDNNDIDRVVTEHKPDAVIIEALWVTPSKFEILQKLHPDVTWVIRLHSELPFIANEGNSIEWLKQYVKFKNVIVSSNSKTFIKSMEPILGEDILYTPNYYPVDMFRFPRTKNVAYKTINVGLFGAVRPLKNSLTQAVAAMTYANKHNRRLKLHINTARIEQNGGNALKNIRALFEGTRHTLVEHNWLEHKDFVKLVAQMDICLQVSLSETYNIVAADAVNEMIPVVTSKEINFVNPFCQVSEVDNAEEIVEVMERVINKPILTITNKLTLLSDSLRAKAEWRSIFGGRK